MLSAQAAPSFSSGALAAASAEAAAVEAAVLSALAAGALEPGAALPLPGGALLRVGRLPLAPELRRLRRDFERLSTTDGVLGGGGGCGGGGGGAGGAAPGATAERFARYLEGVLRR